MEFIQYEVNGAVGKITIARVALTFRDSLWLRSAYNRYNVNYVNGDGDWNNKYTKNRNAGLCPICL